MANAFLASISGGQVSIPIKPWSTLSSRAHFLRPSPGKLRPAPSERMAKAIVASAAANGILLTVDAVVPRRLTINGVLCAIENGCGGDMVAAGMVVPVEPRTEPLEESLRLTAEGFAAIRRFVPAERLVDLGVVQP